MAGGQERAEADRQLRADADRQQRLQALLSSEIRVINIGVPDFAETLARVGTPHVQVTWAPPAGGDAAAVSVLEVLDGYSEKIEAANQEALGRILSGQPVLVDIRPAGEAIPALRERLLLHAGPPIAWEQMCGPMQGAVTGAILFEGWAPTPEEAVRLAASGHVRFAPNHHFGSVGPMAGVVSPSMPLFVVENRTYGNRAYCNLNEGLGKVLRFGAFDETVLTRLAWMRDALAPALGEAIRRTGGIDLKSILARALQMGDECHNRNAAATSLFVRELFRHLVEATADRDRLAAAAAFLAANDHFFLNLSMAACKSMLDAADGIEGSSVVTAMCRNGVEFGIRLSGTGEEWFTAPAPLVEGLYFPGYGPEDAAPDLGDSAITETLGIGGFAMAAAPAIVQFVGGRAGEALAYTREMRTITVGENQGFSIPALDFAGTPTGIDAVRVVDSGIQPLINTGIAHRQAGVGQVGAGLVRAPMACFSQAVRALSGRLAGRR